MIEFRERAHHICDEALIADFAYGIEDKRYASVMASGKRFVLFRIAGHKYWSGRFSPQSYAPVRFVLIRKGHWWMGRDTQKREWEGRTSRADLVNAFQDAERTGKISGE